MLWPCFDHGPCKVVISSQDPSKIISKQKKKSANDPHHFRKRKSPNVPGLWFVNHFPPVRPSPLSARKANWGLDVAWPWVLGWPVQVQYKSNKSQECKSVKFILEWIRYPYIYIHHIFQDHFETALKSFNVMAPKGSKHPSIFGSGISLPNGLLPSNDSAWKLLTAIASAETTTLILNITYFWYLGMGQNMSK